jgi:hypothetical protein
MSAVEPRTPLLVSPTQISGGHPTLDNRRFLLARGGRYIDLFVTLDICSGILPRMTLCMGVLEMGPRAAHHL